MKTLTFTILVLASSAIHGGEPIEGEITSVSNSRNWETGSNAGYYIYSSRGETTWQLDAGDSATECHGAGFWTPREITGDGICIFGKEPDRWTVVHNMPEGSNLWADKSNYSHRQGVWEVIHGTGRFSGMTGSGTFNARDTADGGRITEISGEIELK